MLKMPIHLLFPVKKMMLMLFGGKVGGWTDGMVQNIPILSIILLFISPIPIFLLSVFFLLVPFSSGSRNRKTILHICTSCNFLSRIKQQNQQQVLLGNAAWKTCKCTWCTACTKFKWKSHKIFVFYFHFLASGITIIIIIRYMHKKSHIEFCLCMDQCVYMCVCVHLIVVTGNMTCLMELVLWWCEIKFIFVSCLFFVRLFFSLENAVFSPLSIRFSSQYCLLSGGCNGGKQRRENWNSIEKKLVYKIFMFGWSASRACLHAVLVRFFCLSVLCKERKYVCQNGFLIWTKR